MHDAPLFVENALKVGVNAYVTKADPVETIVEAIYAVNSGTRFMGPTITKTITERISADSCGFSKIKELSTREIEILTSLGKGLTRREIAEKHCLSVRTIDTYFSRLKQKLGITQNCELIREAIKVNNCS